MLWKIHGIKLTWRCTQPQKFWHRGVEIPGWRLARWGSLALTGSLSSDGVTTKILVVIQPYTYQHFLWDVTNVTWTACGKCDGAQPPGPEVLQATTSGVGVSKLPRKTTAIYTRRKTKTITSKNPSREWEKSEYMNALECLLRAEKKGVKKGIGKIVHGL